MTEPTIGVVAVGNALVDVLAHATEDFLATQNTRHGIVKGSMTLVDEARAVEMYDQMGPGVETSGGSAANTIAGIASFGGSAAFIGKVANDTLGRVFAHDVRSLGVRFDTPPLNNGIPTGRCLILVTPDAERTMMTFLGAGVELSHEDVDRDLIASSQVLYLEGYLYDKDQLKRAFTTAAQYAHEAGRKVALSLSDSFCVERHRDDFLALIDTHVDILFANEDEIISLYRQPDFDRAKAAARDHVDIAALTRGAKGAVVLSNGEETVIAPESVPDVKDTTGAGDQFAAGFLYGYTQGMDLGTCGSLGSKAAAQIITHLGSRPLKPFSELL